MTTLNTERFAEAQPHTGTAWDELRLGSGAIRPHWQPLMASMDALGSDEVAIRAENIRRILREHGVSCFSPDAGGDHEVRWELDCTPFVIGAADWRELEAGLVQRARLLDLVLGDLFGVQRLVRDGFIPAPLIHANPGYLRACQAVRVPGGNYLQIYAADVARGPEGRWCVLADRTQAPAGFGFVLENRSVLSRVLGDVLQAVGPRSISEILPLCREALRRLAPAGADNPAIALLTPGPRNESYFEHTYLARLLGFTLVEGGDLTVRDRRVFLKTLDGLRPVDVILRRVSDAFCDPLALRGESLLGVPGLVEAARAGLVSIANALGSGLVESPAFLPFLSGLATHLLGEELKLPSVATWWCGQLRERKHVEAHLDELFLRPAFSTPGPQAEPDALTHAARAEWLGRLSQRPYEFVAQEQVQLSRAPAGNHQSRPVVLRFFVVSNGRDYFAMPGGLARMMHQPALGTTTLALSGGSKDVWVLPDDLDQSFPPSFVATPAPALERLASDLPSRTVENLFWLGRYTERLEQVLRLCRSALGHLAPEAVNGRPEAFAELLARLGLASRPEADGSVHEHLQRELLAVLYEEARDPGVRELLKRIHTASFSVRDRLSADTWRILNRLGFDARTRPGHLPLVLAGAVLNNLVHDLAALSGMEMENMTRGHGWVFLDLGRRIERAVAVARLLEAALHCAARRELLLEPLLEITDSVITYRRRYFAEPQIAGVFDLLLLDATNPRALAFQLAVLERHAASLPAGPSPEGVDQFRQRLAALSTKLAHFRHEAFDDATRPDATVEWLTGFVSELGSLSDLLTHIYFSHVVPRVS
ncbi:MAG: circularly permuted type 2 ATP-grasp protein [Verrucomicrobiota bacterium]